jgi:L-alanine-DL-glutamate epimerase-like enolase superfamily enzyme
VKIAKLESLHCDAGTRDFDFLKLTTDTGLVGWSEYNETFGGPGLSAVIERLAPSVIGKDPRAWEAHVAHMYAVRRQSSGGVIQQAIAAIENAMLDVKARALGIPVRDAGRPGARAHPPLLVPLRHLPGPRLQGDADPRGEDAHDDVVEARQRSGGEGLHGAQDERAALRGQPAQLCPGFARTGEGFPS